MNNMTSTNNNNNDKKRPMYFDEDDNQPFQTVQRKKSSRFTFQKKNSQKACNQSAKATLSCSKKPTGCKKESNITLYSHVEKAFKLKEEKEHTGIKNPIKTEMKATDGTNKLTTHKLASFGIAPSVEFERESTPFFDCFESPADFPTRVQQVEAARALVMNELNKQSFVDRFGQLHETPDQEESDRCSTSNELEADTSLSSSSNENSSLDECYENEDSLNWSESSEDPASTEDEFVPTSDEEFEAEIDWEEEEDVDDVDEQESVEPLYKQIKQRKEKFNDQKTYTRLSIGIYSMKLTEALVAFQNRPSITRLRQLVDLGFSGQEGQKPILVTNTGVSNEYVHCDWTRNLDGVITGECPTLPVYSKQNIQLAIGSVKFFGDKAGGSHQFVDGKQRLHAKIPNNLFAIVPGLSMKFSAFIFFPVLSQQNVARGNYSGILTYQQRAIFYEDLVLPAVKQCMEDSFYNRCPLTMTHADKIKAEYIPYNLHGEDLLKVIDCMRQMVEEAPAKFESFEDFYFVLSSFGSKSKEPQIRHVMKSVNKSLNCQYLKDNEIKCLFDVGYDLDLKTDEKVTVLFMNNTRVGSSQFKHLLRRMESRVLKKLGHTTDFPLACSNLSGGFKFIPSKSQKIKKVIGYNIGLRSQFTKDQNVFAAKELAKAHSGSIDRAVDSYHTSFEAAEYGKYDARIEFRVVQDDIVSTIRRIEQKLGELLERTTHPSVVVYPSNHLFQMMATRMELCLLLAKQLGKQKDHASFSGLVFLSYYLKCQVHSVDPAWSQYKEVASFLRGYSCANNDFMFVPKVFKVLSNGRVQFRHVFSQQTLSNLLPDYQTPVLLVPNATHRINVNDSTVSDLAQLVVATSKRKARLPDVRVLALPLKGREYSQDYLSLFVDVLSIGYGLSSPGAAHYVKILLEEFLEHFFYLITVRYH